MSEQNDPRTSVAAFRGWLFGVGSVEAIIAIIPAFVLSFVPNVAQLVAQSISAGISLIFLFLFASHAVWKGSVTPQAGRNVGIIFGIASLATAWGVSFSTADRGESAVWYAARIWLMASAGALTVLLLAGFVFEMARRDRTRLIESLSIFVASGMVSWASGGWVFAINLFDGPWGDENYGVRIGCAAVLLVFVLLMAWVLPRGLETTGSEEGGNLGDVSARVTLISLGSIPVLITGLIIPLMMLGVPRLF
ncbi:MAG: hypothetical protein LKI93_04500 [Bifidobacteriaceae bacterium]|jgi:hypothetical protein|nr:hypothetical protein [Bifidobacteriaceae bacterium]